MRKNSKKTIIIIVAILSVVPHYIYFGRSAGGDFIKDFYLRSPLILFAIFAVTTFACICLWLIVNYCSYRELTLAICGSVLAIPGLIVFALYFFGLLDHFDYSIGIAFAGLISMVAGGVLIWLAIDYASDGPEEDT